MRILTWERGAVELFGYRREDVIGQDARFIFTQKDREQKAPEHEAATAMSNDIASDDRWHVRKDGTVFWASGFMIAVRDDMGQHVGFVKIVREMPTAEVAPPRWA